MAETWTRRQFVQGAVGAVAVGVAGVHAACSKPTDVHAEAVAVTHNRAGLTVERRTPVEPALRAARPRVVLVRHRDVLDAGQQPRAAIIERMLDDGIKALANADTTADGWRRLIRASDTVGIKSNVWRFLRTPPAVEEALHKRIIEAGVAPKRTAIDDRGVRHNRVFKQATALINVRPMRTHHWAGVGSCIKNYIMFAERPSDWHDDACANLAGLWDLPAVKGKTRLNVLLMLTPLFHGKGPHHFQAEYTWPYRGIVLGTDPVAVDTTGLRILEAKRHAVFGREKPFAVSPRHIRVAADRFGLGVADTAQIDLVRLGWDDEALI